MIKKMDSDLDTWWKENYGCKEDRKLWDNFQSFYKEVIANKHLWKRDMLAITYVDVAKKYGYVGLKVLHPYEDFLITYFPGDYDYWTIAQVLCYPDNHGFETDDAIGGTALRNRERDVNRQFKHFLGKFPELKLSHSSTLVHTAKDIRIREESYYDHESSMWGRCAKIEYTLDLRHKISKEWEKFEKRSYSLQVEDRSRTTYKLWPHQGFCQMYEGDFTATFIKLHESLPKELVQGNFAGLKKARVNLKAKNKKLTVELEKRKQEAFEYEKKHRWAAVKKAKNKRSGSKTKTKTKKEDSLYLMKNNRDGRYKIGISSDPEYREKTLQSQEPDIKLVGNWDTLAKYERAWHDYFSEWRQRGEWFDLELSQVRFMVDKCRNKKAPPEREALKKEAIENIG
mgnify:FL=1